MDRTAAALASILPELDTWLALFVVAMARVGGLVLALPMLRSRVLPRPAKVTIVAGLSAGLVAATDPTPIVRLALGTPGAVAAAAAGELLFGLAVGFVMSLGIVAARIAGSIAGIDMGLSFSAVADPTSGGQSTAVAALYLQLAIQLFLALGLDHATIRVLAAGLAAHPLGAAVTRPADFFDLVGLGGRVFEAGWRLALPASAALLALKVAMAMLARVAPKLQVFSLAFALSILTGLFVLRSALGGIAEALAAHLRSFVELAGILAAGG